MYVEEGDNRVRVRALSRTKHTVHRIISHRIISHYHQDQDQDQQQQ